MKDISDPFTLLGASLSAEDTSVGPPEDTSTASPHEAKALQDTFYSPQNYAFYAHKPYEPLEKSSHCIRLLKVCERDPDKHPVGYEFTNWIPLAEARNTYTAISYCAGDPKNTRSIRVNGLGFNAFANLARALVDTCAYRKEHHDDDNPLIWADQICINQSDKSERSHQVAFMGDIYRGARDVAVCLSSNDEESNVLCLVNALFEDAESPELQNLSTENTQRNSYSSSTVTSFDRARIRLLGQQVKRGTWPRLYNELPALTKAPWWRRAWTFQEFQLAGNAYFLFGGKAALWYNLAAVLLGDFQMSNESEEHMDAVKYQLDNKISPHHTNLLELLKQAYLHQTSDRRDSVYAFLGLVDGYEIYPDYDGKTIETVYTDAARSIITHDNSLQILGWTATSRGAVSATLPSWLPDWTSPAKDEGMQLMRILQDDWPSKTRAVVGETKFLDCGKVLQVTGIFAETLAPRHDWSFYKNIPLFDSSITGRSHCICTNKDAQNEDEVWLLAGLQVPVILRTVVPCEDTDAGCARHRSHTPCATSSRTTYQHTSGPPRYYFVSTAWVQGWSQNATRATWKYMQHIANDERRTSQVIHIY